MRFKCPSISSAERDSVGQRDARLERAARSMGLACVPCLHRNFDGYAHIYRNCPSMATRLLNMKRERLPHRVENVPG